MSLTSPGSSRFCVQVTEKMHVDCNNFCHRMLLSEGTFDRMLQSARKKEKKKRKKKESKTTRKGGILGFTPAYLFYLILTSSCFGQISRQIIVQELCDSRGGRPGLSVLTSLLVSVDVKLY